MRWYRSDLVALPDAGGYDDQDASKMDDLFALLTRFDYHFRRLKKEMSGEADDDDYAEHYVNIYDE